ncbi:MAG: O-antigen ligase family protein [Pyrinomonadaceae bacterium]
MNWIGKLIFILICATIVLTTLAYGAVHQPIIAIFYLATTVMMILWVYDGFSTGSVRFSTSQLQIPIAATVLFGLIQIIPFGTLSDQAIVDAIPRTISLDPFSTMVSALHLLALSIFFSLTLVFVDSASRLRKIVIVITGFGFVYAFFAILQSVLSPDRIYGIYERAFAEPFGSFVNRHNFAAYMEMTIGLPLGLLFVGGVHRDKRLLYFTAVAIMAIALLLSGSRGGLIALLSQIAILTFYLTRSIGWRNIALRAALGMLLIGAVVGGTLYIGDESSVTRMADSATRSQDITSNRTEIWNTSMKVISANLPMGAGLGAFGVAYTPFDGHSGLERVEQAHNDYLQVVADAGVIGIILGGAFLFLLVRTTLQNLKTENIYRRGIVLGAFAGCFAVLVHSLFDFVLHTTAVALLFLTLTALIVVAGKRFADDPEGTYSERKRKRRSASVTSISERRREV